MIELKSFKFLSQSIANKVVKNILKKEVGWGTWETKFDNDWFEWDKAEKGKIKGVRGAAK